MLRLRSVPAEGLVLAAGFRSVLWAVHKGGANAPCSFPAGHTSAWGVRGCQDAFVGVRACGSGGTRARGCWSRGGASCAPAAPAAAAPGGGAERSGAGRGPGTACATGSGAGHGGGRCGNLTAAFCGQGSERRGSRGQTAPAVAVPAVGGGEHRGCPTRAGHRKGAGVLGGCCAPGLSP